MNKTRVLVLVVELVVVAALLTAPATVNAGVPIGGRFVILNENTLPEENPAIAYNSQRQEYLVVWYNDRTNCDDIRAQRVSRGGALVGGPFYVADRSPLTGSDQNHSSRPRCWLGEGELAFGVC